MTAVTAVLQDTDADTIVVTRIMGFVRLLRTNDYRVGIQEELDALKVAQHCGVMDRQRLRWGLRSLLCSDSDEWERFNDLFDAYWLPPNRKAYGQSAGFGTLDTALAQGVPGREPAAAEADQAQQGDDADAAGVGSRGGASHQESLARSDFRQLSDLEQMREMERVAEGLARRMRRRIQRRQRIQNQGRVINLRRTLRNSLQYGGTPLELVFKQRHRQLPRLVLLLDVSRSMSLYSYLFLRFARGILGVFKDADAFIYHTQLIHVTDALRATDMERVRGKLAVMSLGWSGGTRIGECLRRFNMDYAGRMVNSRSVVIMVSDGFDTGAPELLVQQLDRIKNRAAKIVWLNPLLGREGYQPIAAGMQAALPLLDLFAPAHNLASLAALESHLAAL